MSMPKIIDDVIHFFSGAISRIFGPDDDREHVTFSISNYA
jgi:hypothetical protein